VFEQVIVSNVDQVVPVFAAASPTPKWGLLDRYLVSAEASGLPALIVITKLDLALQEPPCSKLS
jgi:ribosome biogenesis GTPase / thiamine phosphate phosphatase